MWFSYHCCVQPLFQPSINKWCKPSLAVKSIYSFACAVVAPCLSPSQKVYFPMCIAHQIPKYLYGFTYDGLPILLGSFRFKIK
ncbi:hypothetical protein D3C84_536210 [compost metagenome]